MRVRFTKGWAQKVAVEVRTRFVDDGYPALNLRVSPAGGKVFYYRARHKGFGLVERKIGSFELWTVEQARVQAGKLAGSFNAGIDPDTLQSDEQRAALTLADGFALYKQWYQVEIRAGRLRASSWTVSQSLWKRHLSALGKMKLHQITTQVAQSYLREKRDSYNTYNASLSLLNGIFKTVSDETGVKHPSPVEGMTHLPTHVRERFLQPDEVQRFFQELLLEDQDRRDLVLCLLMTGQRKGAVISMEFKALDLAGRRWIIPSKRGKGGRPQTVPLLDAVVTILQRRKDTLGGRFVFPSKRTKTGHISQDMKWWKGLADRAGLLTGDKDERLAIHDLRRTMGSWQAMQGSSLQQIAKSLGHSNIGTTARVYAHLLDDGARGVMTGAIDALVAAAGGNAPVDRVDQVLASLGEEERAELLKRLKG